MATYTFVWSKSGVTVAVSSAELFIGFDKSRNTLLQPGLAVISGGGGTMESPGVVSVVPLTGLSSSGSVPSP